MRYNGGAPISVVPATYIANQPYGAPGMQPATYQPTTTVITGQPQPVVMTTMVQPVQPITYIQQPLPVQPVTYIQQPVQQQTYSVQQYLHDPSGSKFSRSPE